MRKPRAIVFEHDPSAPLCALEQPLVEAGFDVTVRRQELCAGDEDAPFWVLLGGHMGVYDAEKYPFLRQELAALKARLAEDRPVLGICLGAQLMAAARDVPVYKGAAGVELGALPITLTEAGAADPVFSPLPRVWQVPQWHGDTFHPVRGAVRLAGSQQYPEQAFRLGRSYAIQFHAEVDAARFESWVLEAPSDARQFGYDVDRQLAEDVRTLEANAPVQEAFLRRLADHFFALAAHP